MLQILLSITLQIICKTMDWPKILKLIRLSPRFNLVDNKTHSNINQTKLQIVRNHTPMSLLIFRRELRTIYIIVRTLYRLKTIQHVFILMRRVSVLTLVSKMKTTSLVQLSRFHLTIFQRLLIKITSCLISKNLRILETMRSFSKISIGASLRQDMQMGTKT